MEVEMANGEENTIKSKEKKYQNCIHKHPSLIEEGIVELSDALTQTQNIC